MPAAREWKICPECGADCARDAPYCWMCRADLSHMTPVVTAELVAPAPGRASEIIFAFVTVLLVGLACLIGLELLIDKPGLAILYAIIAVPPIVATLVRIQNRQQQVGRISWGESFVTLLVSTVVTIGAIFLMALAAVVALGLFCAAIFSPSFR